MPPQLSKILPIRRLSCHTCCAEWIFGAEAGISNGAHTGVRPYELLPSTEGGQTVLTTYSSTRTVSVMTISERSRVVEVRRNR